MEFEYIIPVTATVEKDEKGREFIMAKITNPFIKEDKTSHRLYLDFKKERHNPNDGTDIKEMKISEKIDQEIHEVWKIFNPSGEKLSVHPSGRQARTKQR